MRTDSINSTRYFAGAGPEELKRAVISKFDLYYQHLKTTGRIDIWSRIACYYNNGIAAGARINWHGEQGEYSELPVNHLRNILLHILNLATSQKIAYEAQAINSDHKSMAQTIVAKGVLEYYQNEKGLDAMGRRAVEDVLQYGDAYIYEAWDFGLGDPIQADPAQPNTIIKSGDIFFKNFSPLDVAFDIGTGICNANKQWYILRDYQNKWDLIQKFPEQREKIITLSGDDKNARNFASDLSGYESDHIPVYIFFHDRTEAMPNGRLFVCLTDNIWLTDMQLPKYYKRLPLHRLYASEQRGTGFGYSTAYDLCPLQEAITGLVSTILTNQSAFGVQNILVPDGSNLSTTALSDGLNMINYNARNGEPKVLELLKTPGEIFTFLEVLVASMETISGVNSVARGNPEASLKSGSALALVQSMAIQFISDLQRAYIKFMADIGNGAIEILKDNANTKRMIEISGKNNRAYMKEFDKSDLDQISRVRVEIGNPLTMTTAGKVNIAEQLLSANMIETPAQFIQVLTTGNLDPLIEGKQSELMLIKLENETMSEGNSVQATMVDNHPLHIMEHKCVMASPIARETPNVVQAVLGHIMEHINLWKTGDPALLAMLGQPTPPPMGAIPAPGAEGQEGQEGGGQARPTDVVAAENPTAAIEAKADAVNIPNMPTNPMTGERAAVPQAQI